MGPECKRVYDVEGVEGSRQIPKQSSVPTHRNDSTSNTLHHSAYTSCRSTHHSRQPREPRINGLPPPQTALVMLLAGSQSLMMSSSWTERVSVAIHGAIAMVPSTDAAMKWQRLPIASRDRCHKLDRLIVWCCDCLHPHCPTGRWIRGRGAQSPRATAFVAIISHSSSTDESFAKQIRATYLTSPLLRG